MKLRDSIAEDDIYRLTRTRREIEVVMIDIAATDLTAAVGPGHIAFTIVEEIDTRDREVVATNPKVVVVDKILQSRINGDIHVFPTIDTELIKAEHKLQKPVHPLLT